MTAEPSSPLPRTREAYAAAQRALDLQMSLPFGGHSWPDQFPTLVQKLQDVFRWLKREGDAYGDARLSAWIETVRMDCEVVEVKRLRDESVKGGTAQIQPNVYDGTGAVSVYGSVVVGDGGVPLFDPGPPVIEEPASPNPLNKWVFAPPSHWSGRAVLEVMAAYLSRWESELLPNAELRAAEPSRRRKVRHDAGIDGGLGT